MNKPLLARFLGTICLLIGGSMVFSLPFAHPILAVRTHLPPAESFETAGAIGLVASVAVCLVVGGVLHWFGRGSKGDTLYQKEAMAIVGLSWVAATILGALPYAFAGVEIKADQPITMIEAMFESQSGFSTTGATVLTDLETPASVPHCILFWRSSTHFLGGLGIIVLFVAILGQGSAGKAIMRAEMPGPTNDGSMPRMQQAAWSFAGIYLGFNVILTAVYLAEGMTAFDAICHAFGTMATGGFSTYNASLGGFRSSLIEWTTIVFMILAGTNFTLLYLTLRSDQDRLATKRRSRLRRLFGDLEFRTYLGIIAVVSAAIIFFGVRAGDAGFGSAAESLRNGIFQVVSVMTTTGYGTADFDQWNNFGRGVLLLLMFVGGCAGSTGGGMKVIRHVLLAKILSGELERAHRPRVVRPLRIGGRPIDDPRLPHAILLYFCMVTVIYVVSWLLLVTVEPDTTWGVRKRGSVTTTEINPEKDKMGQKDPTTPDRALSDQSDVGRQLLAGTLDEKLLDSASAVAATLNNIGPGLGVVGATRNYAGFSQHGKLLFVFLMMLGRVEIYCILLLFAPSFWRRV